MKKLFIISFLCVSLFVVSGCEEEEAIEIFEDIETAGLGNAVVITGASARIAQQIALLERLDNTGRLNLSTLNLITGVSSGGINTIMLNGVLDQTNNFDWEDYKQLVFSISGSDILENDRNNLPVSTKPLHKTFKDVFIAELGFNSLDDLIVNSALTATRLSDSKITVATNITGLPGRTFEATITEALMATSSFPVAFPAIKIGNETYVDGGLEENIPINVVLKFQEMEQMAFDTVFIVSYQKNEIMNWEQELNFLNVTRAREDFLKLALERADVNTDQLSQKAFIDELRFIQSTYPNLAKRVKVYVPNISNLPYYGVFDFRSETARDSYEDVRDWSLDNDPILLVDYLNEFGN